MPNLETEPVPMSKSTSGFRTGVGVPSADRRWAGKLTEAFSHLPAEYQTEITGLIGNLSRENPTRAREIARQISNFFGGVGKAENLSSFLERLRDQIETERRKHLH